MDWIIDWLPIDIEAQMEKISRFPIPRKAGGNS